MSGDKETRYLFWRRSGNVIGNDAAAETRLKIKQYFSGLRKARYEL
jgi:hypothetical protein